MQKYDSYSATDTRQTAAILASQLHAGDVICLGGDLGAGKTVFVSGVAKALGFTGYVNSPTFTIVNEYVGTMPIYHFDVYRLADSDEFYAIGADEYLYGDGVCVIEWAQRVEDILPAERINVSILKDDKKGDDYRLIVIERISAEGQKV